ncbi:uncharacterized protein LOC111087562 [Limulus polyphemus]|uniref:Uncharacterized protein LOC111087562 n=1 Tax=Limulus polyphemus TaxID=6850 RepID=A0ABM1T346_LIMPO|nr:uncharacterized protein LOC111087562 [Limulus polyphemus]
MPVASRHDIRSPPKMPKRKKYSLSKPNTSTKIVAPWRASQTLEQQESQQEINKECTAAARIWETLKERDSRQVRNRMSTEQAEETSEQHASGQVTDRRSVAAIRDNEVPKQEGSAKGKTNMLLLLQEQEEITLTGTELL